MNLINLVFFKPGSFFGLLINYNIHRMLPSLSLQLSLKLRISVMCYYSKFLKLISQYKVSKNKQNKQQNN